MYQDKMESVSNGSDGGWVYLQKWPRSLYLPSLSAHLSLHVSHSYVRVRSLIYTEYILCL